MDAAVAIHGAIAILISLVIYLLFFLMWRACGCPWPPFPWGKRLNI